MIYKNIVYLFVLATLILNSGVSYGSNSSKDIIDSLPSQRVENAVSPLNTGKRYNNNISNFSPLQYSSLQSGKVYAYYGAHFYQTNYVDKDLKNLLGTILSGYHNALQGQYDIIAGQCMEGYYCYTQRVYKYNEARRFLFGHLHLTQIPQYAVQDYYCLQTFTPQSFRKDQKPIGPGLIPSSRVINAEHAWPQSYFNKNLPKMIQKSDLHSLFPVKAIANSTRSNLPLGNITHPRVKQPCSAARVGRLAQGFNSDRTFFEPPNAKKGDIARALFYFSARYNMKISKLEEYFLRMWHRQDPVDAFEEMRNQGVFEFQYNRNPFVDYPELVDRIRDF